MSVLHVDLLRRELSQRNVTFAQKHALEHSCTLAELPSVTYRATELHHGNFLPASYKAIKANGKWAARLSNASGQSTAGLHTEGRWTKLDAGTSSDALLMNVFCCPAVLRCKTLQLLLEVGQGVKPEFGYRPRIPLMNGRGDRTEVDMRLGSLLVEAKLTEADFQRAPRSAMCAYRDFGVVFEPDELPQDQSWYFSYQLIRNVLAAYALDCSFCLITDARRPDLVEMFCAVIRAIRNADMRYRSKLLLWQELSTHLPRSLRSFLSEKYGIESV